MSRSVAHLLFASAYAIGMVVLALWCWDHAADIAGYYDPRRPDLVVKAVRSGAVATIAGAQLVVLFFVIGRFYGRRAFDRVFTWVAASVVAVAATCTIVFAAGAQ